MTALSVSVIVWFCSPVGAQSRFFPEAKKEGKVVLYTSLAGTDTKPFKESFEKNFRESI